MKPTDIWSEDHEIVQTIQDGTIYIFTPGVIFHHDVYGDVVILDRDFTNKKVRYLPTKIFLQRGDAMDTDARLSRRWRSLKNKISTGEMEIE